MRRLALAVGEASLTSVFQVILLYAGSFAAHSDMPLPCGLPEGKAASLLPPGTTMLLAFICASIPWANRVYLCPSAVADVQVYVMFQRAGYDHPEGIGAVFV